MAQLVSNKFVIGVMDTNQNTTEYSVPNINPAISDTTLLKTAAQKINSLSDGSVRFIYLDQRVDITSD